MTPGALPAARKARPVAWQTIAAFGLLAGLSVFACVYVGRMIDHEERDRLEDRSTEVGTVLSSALVEVNSALGLLLSLTEPEDSGAFTKASTSLLVGQAKAIGRADRTTDDTFVVGAGVGDVELGETIAADRAVILDRALVSDNVVTGLVHSGEETRLMFAMANPDEGHVAYRETAIDQTRVVSTVRGEAFGDVDVSVYVTSTADPASVILKTSTTPLTDGHQTELKIGADTWLLVTAARGNLADSLSPRAPWFVLGFGLLLAAAVAVSVETLNRRHRFALKLVDRRTVELRDALEERSQLEQLHRAAREEAEAANRAKSEFLSRMSHELRTPLNGVLGFAQLLDLEDLQPRQRDAVEQITKGGWHLLALINEVLDISHIETGTMALSPEPVLASEVLNESLDLVRPIAEEHGIHLLSGSKAGCDVHMYADRQRVKQVLLNLLSNAIKYNRHGGSVSVSCARRDDQFTILVDDTGPGIPADKLDRLFVPFERLGAEHSGIEGSGIGLALSRRLAEVMGGTLDVSTVVGQGSTFALQLPVVEGPVERFVRLGPTLARPEIHTNGVASRKIVYVEDNLSNLRLVERLLENRPDVDVIAAMQGRLGLDLVRQHDPDVVLLDLHLPDIEGAEVLRQLREDPVTSSIPVIVVSADATAGQVGRILAAGAYAYLTKPLDVAQLLTMLDTLLAEPERVPNGSRRPTHSRV